MARLYMRSTMYYSENAVKFWLICGRICDEIYFLRKKKFILFASQYTAEFDARRTFAKETAANLATF